MPPRNRKKKIGWAIKLLAALALTAPWTAGAATRNVSAGTVTTLHKWVDSVDVHLNNHYVITLTNSTTPYVLAKTLKVAKGAVEIKGATDLTNAHKYVLEGGYPNGSGFKRIFEVAAFDQNWFPTLSLTGVTVQGGYKTGDGAGLYLNRGNAYITHCYFQGNTASSKGSGLYATNGGELYLYNCVVRNNINYQAQFNQCGGLTAGGGGLAADGTHTIIERSTFTGNQACRGAGIAVYPGGGFLLQNSTISGNNANKRGGGLFLQGTHPGTTLAFNTITANKAGTHAADPSGFYEEKYGGGIAFSTFGGYLDMYGNILAKNQTVNSDKATLFYHGHDCYDRITSVPARNFHYQENYIGALGNCTMLGNDGWPRIGWEGAPEDPLLGGLTPKTGTNGPQYTHAPASASPAIGNYYKTGPWGNASYFSCPYNDQLGRRRDWYENYVDYPSRCDIGAHQYNWFH